MANIRKKVINVWDGGIQTSPRDSKQDTSFGAQEVKHFDVYTDPKKLTPMPDWTDFTNVEERVYNIRALGGFSDTIYGLGSCISNWYSSSWSHRVKVTASANVLAGLPFYVDLSLMPAGFWSAVQTDGGDIRCTNDDAVTGIPCYIENFDTVGETGQLWVDSIGTAGQEFYIYYGNADVSVIPSSTFMGYQNQPINAWTSPDFAYTFPEDVQNRPVGSETDEAFTTEPDYVTGQFGKAIETIQGEIETDNDDEVALTGNDITLSFMIYLDASPSNDATILEDGNGTWSVEISTSRYVKFFVNGTSGNTTVTSTNQLSTGQWYVIDCVFDNDHYIYVDGVEETWNTNDGSYDDNTSNNTLQVSTLDSNNSSFCKLAQVWGIDNDLSQDAITSKYNNFLDNANFWTIGSEEAFVDAAPQYSGIQLYTKDISSGDWEDVVTAQQPVKSLSYFPVNGFVESHGGNWYFITSQDEHNEGFLYLGKTDSFNIIDPNHLSLNTVSPTIRIAPTSSSPVDKSIYFTHFSTGLGEVGDPGSSSVFGANNQIESHVPWRNYLALVSNRRNRGLVEIWDLNNVNPLDVADCGTGNARIIGNAEDVLFTVVDNFLDDTTKSSGTPTVQLKKYVGNGRMEDVVTIEVPANIESYDDQWERAVSNFSFRRDDATLFYAKIPTNAAATTFNEGFWGVGVNSQGKLALTLMMDTSDIGDFPEQIHSFAKQIFFIEKNGNIKRLSTSGSYTKTSSYKTLKMNEGNTEIEKVLKGVEIITEPLESGQTITLYYKTDSDASRIKIGEISGEDEITKEFVVDNTGTSFNNYKEVEFEIESTGGKSGVLELNYKYEYTSDVV